MTEKWALVTGASSGIGLDFARQLASRQYNLILVARSKDKLQEIQKQLTSASCQVRIVAMDLAKPEAPAELLTQTEQWKITPEVLINNAGIGAHGPFLEHDWQEAKAMLDLNVTALVQLSHIYGRKMVEKGQGYILQVASTASFQPMPSYAIYAASKSFVLSFSRAFNFEVRHHGVSSTALCPGPTATNFFAAAHHAVPSNLSRMMMKPEEVARQGLEAMFARREAHVSGLLNKVGAMLPRLLPSQMMVKGVAFFMK